MKFLCGSHYDTKFIKVQKSINYFGRMSVSTTLYVYDRKQSEHLGIKTCQNWFESTVNFGFS